MMTLPKNSLYTLQWAEYGTSMVSTIQFLRCHTNLADCTLAAGGRRFAAHKIVLCAASPFLMDLLKHAQSKHPVIILDDVDAHDLEALLDFVYRGEVNIELARLPLLLQTAKSLNILGLATLSVVNEYTDFTQLQHIIPQHGHDQNQFVEASAPQQTQHAQVVENFCQTNQIFQATFQTNTTEQQGTTSTCEQTNDPTLQCLPLRKRKRLIQKLPTTSPQVPTFDGIDAIIAASEAHAQPSLTTEGVAQISTSTPHINSVGKKVDTMATMDHPLLPVATGNPSAGNLLTAPGTNEVSKDPTNASDQRDKSRSQSRSEQPTTCPICFVVICQSRNFRRHLQLKHFAGVKSEGKKKKKKSGNKKNSVSSTANNVSESTAVTLGTVNTVPNVQSVELHHTSLTVQVKKNPHGQNQDQTIPAITQGGQQQQQVQQVQQYQHHEILDQLGNISINRGTDQKSQQSGQQQLGAHPIVTENTGGSASLSMPQVQTLQGQQIFGTMQEVNIPEFKSLPSL